MFHKILGTQVNLVIYKYNILLNYKIRRKESKPMSRVYYCEPEGEEIDCPDCGSPAIYNDDGIVCSNDDCKNS